VSVRVFFGALGVDLDSHAKSFSCQMYLRSRRRAVELVSEGCVETGGWLGALEWMAREELFVFSFFYWFAFSSPFHRCVSYKIFRQLQNTQVRQENQPENISLCLDVAQRKFNFAINTTQSDKCEIQRLDPIRRHDDLHVSPGVEPIELIEKLQHRSLDLTFTTRR
jgi:hypothetical protein